MDAGRCGKEIGDGGCVCVHNCSLSVEGANGMEWNCFDAMLWTFCFLVSIDRYEPFSAIAPRMKASASFLAVAASGCCFEGARSTL